MKPSKEPSQNPGREPRDVRMQNGSMSNRLKSSFEILTAPNPSSPDCDHVRAWLREFNHAANAEFFEKIEKPEHASRPLVLIARDGGAVVGGLFAETRFAWLRVAIMAVDPARRGRGVGSALLVEAERQAIARGCAHAYVDTMDYQAPEFYAARGYAVAGRIEDWDSHGHAKLFFTKRLATATAQSAATR